MTQTVTPILRIFDLEKTKEFYIDYLGFAWDWEHRFDDNAPLYGQISRNGVVLHLTEHYGDCCPGTAFRILWPDLAAFHAEISAKNYRYARPGLETVPWGEQQVRIQDPFHNRLIFWTPTGEGG